MNYRNFNFKEAFAEDFVLTYKIVDPTLTGAYEAALDYANSCEDLNEAEVWLTVAEKLKTEKEQMILDTIALSYRIYGEE